MAHILHQKITNQKRSNGSQGAWEKMQKLSNTRKTQILEAAERVFVRLGLRRTTMEDIAEEVGVSRPAVYQYFPSKKELVIATFHRFHERLLDRVRQKLKNDDSLKDRLKSALIAREGSWVGLSSKSSSKPWFLDTRQKDIHELLKTFQTEYENMLSDCIKGAVKNPKNAELTAKMLTMAATGGHLNVSSRQEFKDQICFMIDHHNFGDPMHAGEGEGDDNLVLAHSGSAAKTSAQNKGQAGLSENDASDPWANGISRRDSILQRRLEQMRKS